MKREVKEISLDQIVEPQHELRSYARQENLNELAASIRKRGVIEPIIVTPRGKKYEIVAGWRRFKASQLAKKATIPCIVTDAKGLDLEAIKLQENLLREDVDHISIAQYLKRLKEKYHLTERELAELVGKSVAYVSQHLSILKYDDGIREAIQDGMIEWTVGRHLNAITDPDTRRLYLQEAIKRGINSQTARIWKENWQREQGIKKQTGHAKVTEGPQEPPPPFKIKCFNCKREFDQQQATVIHLCPACAQALYEARYREEKSG